MNNSWKRGILASLIAILLWPAGLVAQEIKTNYVEENVPAYTLPDVLKLNNGKKVRNRRVWEKRRRAEILEVFSQEMYGHVPARPEGLHFETLSLDTVYAGLGLRKVVRIYLDEAGAHWFDALVHIPRGFEGPAPFFAGLNFKGNDATLDERSSSRWPFEMILGAGWGVITAWRDGVEPDGPESLGYTDPRSCCDGGVRAWYNPGGDWGAISAWAWGLSRLMDYLETEPDADASRVVVMGHSRLGKTALWAGANDSRFAGVVSNCSGCCGAAISRRCFGENFTFIMRVFPHWFTREFDKYDAREADFPADQHWLAALAAPRPLYIVSATKDGWADPKGEWTCAAAVAPVYKLYRKKGLASRRFDASVMPDPDCPISDGSVAYHLHEGKHGITAFEWAQYLRFFSKNL